MEWKLVKARLISGVLNTLLIVAEYHQRDEKLTLATLVENNLPMFASSTTKYYVEKLWKDGYIEKGKEGVSRRTQVRTTYKMTKSGVEFLCGLHNRIAPIMGCGYDALG